MQMSISPPSIQIETISDGHPGKRDAKEQPADDEIDGRQHDALPPITRPR